MFPEPHELYCGAQGPNNKPLALTITLNSDFQGTLVSDFSCWAKGPPHKVGAHRAQGHRVPTSTLQGRQLFWRCANFSKVKRNIINQMFFTFHFTTYVSFHFLLFILQLRFVLLFTFRFTFRFTIHFRFMFYISLYFLFVI